jgi:hypothetical protein
VTEDEDTPLQRPRLERVGLVGATSADRIRASGHACRIKQAGHMAAPDRYNVKSEITSCEVGVVHTWPLYAQLASAVKGAAQRLGVPIIWGGDWASFPDGPHFELDRGKYP